MDMEERRSDLRTEILTERKKKKLKNVEKVLKS